MPPVVDRSAAPAIVLDAALVERLRRLATTQGDRYGPALVEVPPVPLMVPVAPPELPAQFCSAEARNAFHAEKYVPAVDRGTRNNAAAIAHMEMLARLSREANEAGDSNRASIMAKASQDYGPLAQAAYRERAALDGMFGRIMAVPIMPC